MYVSLQETDGMTERQRGNAREVLGQALADFLFPEGTSWDAPLDGSSLPMPAMPATGLRKAAAPVTRGERWSLPARQQCIRCRRRTRLERGCDRGQRHAPGLARTQHLVPGQAAARAMARAVRRWTSRASPCRALPRSWPAAMAGSPGGSPTATSIPATWSCSSPWTATRTGTARRRAQGARPRAGATVPDLSKPEVLTIEESIWGPVIGFDRQGSQARLPVDRARPRCREPAGRAGTGRGRERARGAHIAHRMGIPHQNLVVGRCPGQHRLDGHERVCRNASGMTAGCRHPGPTAREAGEDISARRGARRLQPRGQRIWTANARVVGGEALSKLGFGAYDHGSRARQIRDASLPGSISRNGICLRSSSMTAGCFSNAGRC